MSTIEYRPKGRALIRTGSVRESRLNSSWLITSRQKSMPAARASSGACSTTLVEPPIAMATRVALRSDAGTTMSRGLMSRSASSCSASSSWAGNSSTRRRSSDAGLTMCSGSMPQVAMNDCMVL